MVESVTDALCLLLLACALALSSGGFGSSGHRGPLRSRIATLLVGVRSTAPQGPGCSARWAPSVTPSTTRSLRASSRRCNANSWTATNGTPAPSWLSHPGSRAVRFR